MLICRKCGKQIPYRVLIDGKMRTMNRRKFCLECSPFGSHNHKDLTIPQDHKLCKSCGEVKPYDDFYPAKNSFGRFSSRCKSCFNRNILETQRKRKQRCVEYKGGQCAICGYNKYLGSLVFHHLDPTQKEFKPSLLNHRSFEKVKEELDKCILVCANCHGEIHAGLIDVEPAGTKS